MRLVERLIATRVTVPRSDVLSRLVAKGLAHQRQAMAQQVGAHLTPPLQEGLQTLLGPPRRSPRGAKYHLSQLKHLSQSTKT